MISILVVDDSAFMRKALTTILEQDPELKVIATARNGEEALELIRRHDPDVVTLDVEMPKMDGLTCLKHIMTEMPRPVLMVSSLTSEGAEATLKALEYGAVDFIVKQQMGFAVDLTKLENELTERIKTVARRRILRRPMRSPSPASGTARPGSLPLGGSTSRPATCAGTPGTRPTAATPPASPGLTGSGRKVPAAPPTPTVAVSGAATFVRGPVPSGRTQRDLVVVGVSTGGPPAVQKVLSALPGDFPAAILIAQHMPAAFTGPFAKRLDSTCAITVKEAENGDKVRAGTAYIAPGGKHIRVNVLRGQMEIEVTGKPEDALYKPSANVLIESSAAVARRTLCAVLTGMGSDGYEGATVLKSKGGRILAQSDATCVVYGMPKAIVDAGLADDIVDIDDMALAMRINLYK